MLKGEEYMNQNIDHVLLDAETIQKRVAELGEMISNDYEGKETVVICILKGAVMFFADLTRHITVHLKMDFMGISSYGDAAKTSGIIRISKDIDTSITGKDVLIVEDIMDSGLTLSHLKRLLGERQPNSLKICCLLDKPSRRECDITPDYTGFVIPDEFVVGYGLDFMAEYRNLPYVGVMKKEYYERILNL